MTDLPNFQSNQDPFDSKLPMQPALILNSLSIGPSTPVNAWFSDVSPASDHLTYRAFLALQSLDPMPQLVISNLIDPVCDALDVASKLQDLAFSGTFRAVAPVSPNISQVRNEVRSVAPKVRFEIWLPVNREMRLWGQA